MVKKLKIPKEILFDLYMNQKKSCSEIGKIYERDAQTVHNWLVKWEIPRRTTSESLKDRKNTWGDKIAESLRGQKLTEERKKKIAISNYKTGICTYRRVKKSKCERCESDKFLIVHHKDENRENNVLENLETLCKSCHQAHHWSKRKCRKIQQ